MFRRVFIGGALIMGNALRTKRGLPELFLSPPFTGGPPCNASLDDVTGNNAYFNNLCVQSINAQTIIYQGGTLGISWPLLAPTGLATGNIPMYSFTDYRDTGTYFIPSSGLQFRIHGKDAWFIDYEPGGDPNHVEGFLGCATDNTFDIGYNGFYRPRDLWLARHATVTGSLSVVADPSKGQLNPGYDIGLNGVTSFGPIYPTAPPNPANPLMIMGGGYIHQGNFNLNGWYGTGDNGDVWAFGYAGVKVLGFTDYGLPNNIFITVGAGLEFSPTNTLDVGNIAWSLIPRNVFASGAIATGVKAGAAVDADVINPTSGMIRVDSTNNRLYVRVGTTWRYTTLT